MEFDCRSVSIFILIGICPKLTICPSKNMWGSTVLKIIILTRLYQFQKIQKPLSPLNVRFIRFNESYAGSSY